jgi:hypothetical protein
MRAQCLEKYQWEKCGVAQFGGIATTPRTIMVWRLDTARTAVSLDLYLNVFAAS